MTEAASDSSDQEYTRDGRDTLLALQTTSQEATGVGASDCVYGIRKQTSYHHYGGVSGPDGEIPSVIETRTRPYQATQGVPVQAESIDERAVLVSHRTSDPSYSFPVGSLHYQINQDKLSLTYKAKVSLTKLRTFCGCKTVCMILTLTTLVCVLSSSFAIAMCLPKTKHKMYTVFHDDTILLGQINPFWYNEVTVSKTSNFQTDEHKLTLYSSPCRDLVTDEYDYSRSSPSVLDCDDNFLLLNPEYFIDGSKIRLNVTVYNITNPSAKVLVGIFHNLTKFTTFQEGSERVKNGTDVIAKTINIADQNLDKPTSTIVEFKIPITGYYFMGMSILSSNTHMYFKYNCHIHRYTYSRLDYYYTPECTINTTESCTYKIKPDITNSEGTKTCVLLYANHPIFEGLAYVNVDYTLSRIQWNIFSIVFGALFMFFVVSVTCTTIYFCMCSLLTRQSQAKYSRL